MNKKLKAFRAEFGIKQDIMASIIDVAPNTYSKKERLDKFNQEEMKKILTFAKRYDSSVTADHLFFSA